MTELVLVVIAIFALLAWHWYLDAQSAEKNAQRAHELAVHATRVVVDQKQLDEALSLAKRLEERVKTLEYRPR